jgi:hypothetical protein
MAHALVAQSYPPRPIQATPQLLSRAVVALHHLEALWNHPYLRIIYCTTALLPPSSLMTKRLVGAMVQCCHPSLGLWFANIMRMQQRLLPVSYLQHTWDPNTLVAYYYKTECFLKSSVAILPTSANIFPVAHISSIFACLGPKLDR